MSYYPLFSERDLELDYEFNARESYLEELRAEHFDPCWDEEPDPEAAAAYEAELAAEADRDGRDAWADIEY